ncbi:MAG TPA: PAS domain-containing hybrid sensor histidine kinase/response regulator, partial [Thiotrichales bacterium]|nr:PAS domain-containing hybrid sensor histidine kinase/response regulator [Thiotrichales bacterium]
DGWQQALHKEDRERIFSLWRRHAQDRQPWDAEYRFCSPDGTVSWVMGRAIALRDAHGEVSSYVGINIDITDRKQTEHALRRSQKMDAIGQLTGGIAHDFNNILSIILGNLDMLKRQIDGDEKTLKRIDNIAYAAERAASLTSQLLGFSRQKAASTEPTDINKVIHNMENLITQALTPQVEIVHQLADDLWQTDIDAGDFEDALLNIVLNARDAMNGQGKLTIETKNCTLDETYARINPGVIPGDYVQLAISDSGSGIPFEMQDRIFEPFFTTKSMDKGTGLGLAMVFGFVKRAGGNIKVYSESGIGTTFRLYLPRAGELPETTQTGTVQPDSLTGGQETILVVDDEQALLELVEETLQQLGYNIITASDGKQALAILNSDQAIDMLFTDVVMPGGINGYELADMASSIRPQLKVLLTSGYTEMAVCRNGQARFNANMLSKPYTQVELSRIIRDILGKTQESAE